jgi:urease accessory protein
VTILLRGTLVAALVLAAGSAAAHDVVPGVGGFYGGLMHPLLVPAHALALAGLGLFVGGQSRRIGAGLTALFAAALVVGVTAVVSAVSPMYQDDVVVVIAAASGILVALARPVSVLVSAPLVVVAGVAIMLDSVPHEISMQTTFLALVGTAIAAVVIATFLAEAARAAGRDWQRIGVRILGSWVAASAILVLALRLAR